MSRDERKAERNIPAAPQPHPDERLIGPIEKPRQRRRLRATVGRDEVVYDGQGRVIDDAYVERAVDDAVRYVSKRRDR